MSNQSIEKQGHADAADTGHLRTYFQDVDEHAVKELGEKYGDLVPPERLRSLRENSTSFETPPDFVKNYRAQFGHAPEAGLVGYTERDRPAHVSTEDTAGIPGTVIHERLHQLSDANAAKVFGNELYEGVTEDLAIEVSGKEPEPTDRVAYPKARAEAHALRHTLGDDAIKEAYFGGDTSKLRERLETTMNHGRPEQEPPGG